MFGGIKQFFVPELSALIGHLIEDPSATMHTLGPIVKSGKSIKKFCTCLKHCSKPHCWVTEATGAFCFESLPVIAVNQFMPWRRSAAAHEVCDAMLSTKDQPDDTTHGHSHT